MLSSATLAGSPPPRREPQPHAASRNSTCSAHHRAIKLAIAFARQFAATIASGQGAMHNALGSGQARAGSPRSPKS
eukprot:scaffold129989_cov63-Phaeocystis_antarctica.AAC.2